MKTLYVCTNRKQAIDLNIIDLTITDNDFRINSNGNTAYYGDKNITDLYHLFDNVIDLDKTNNIMSEFKGTKWSLGGISGRMIKTNEYGGFIADVDTKANALLISKAPEMLEMLNKVLEINKTHNFNGHLINEQIDQLIKQATEI